MAAFESRIAEELALARSIILYHDDPAKNAAMDRLYGRFLKPGDLAFDIGSHVGDRIASFRRLGARVVALEPQESPAAIIERIFGGDRDVVLVRSACAGEEGSLTLRINSRNPTVSTASSAFVTAADGMEGWKEQVWDRQSIVPATTLDLLIAEFGTPAFVKVDVEGLEDAVLRGLSSALPALSFEFTTIQREVALRCLERLGALGFYRYNIALGESQQLTFETPVTVEVMAEHLRRLPHEANSGDVYAVLAE